MTLQWTLDRKVRKVLLAAASVSGQAAPMLCPVWQRDLICGNKHRGH